MIDNMTDNISDNTSDMNELSQEDKLLIEEYRYVRTRQETREPDVDEAWRQFEAKNMAGRKVVRNHRSMRPYKWAAAIAALIVVACVAYMMMGRHDQQEMASATNNLLIHGTAHNAEPTLVFEANRQSQNITMADRKTDCLPAACPTPTKPASADTAQCGQAQKSVPISCKVLWRTLTTPRGETCELTLSDGTEVKLNADSKMSFPIKFTGKIRQVKLFGEAFFKVAKDKDCPFVVETDNVVTMVLGTEFDVKAYKESTPVVTLMSGSVRVGAKGSNSTAMLVPGQEARWADGRLSVGDSTEGTTAWTEDRFVFHQTSLSEAVKEIGRWYNVDIQLTDPTLMYATITMTASRNYSLLFLTSCISNTPNLSAKLKDKTLVISPKSQATEE